MNQGHVVRGFMLGALLVLTGCAGPGGLIGRGAPVEDRSSAAPARRGAVSDGTRAPRPDGEAAAGVRVLSLPESDSSAPVQELPDGSGSLPSGAAPRPYDTAPVQDLSPPVGEGGRSAVRGNPAVVALVDRADQQAEQGSLDQSGATLERALRIDPDNAGLWSRLASVRLSQGQPQQAAQLAAKSNALAGGNRGLMAENWRLIARARDQTGDRAGARAALEEARRLSPAG